MLETKKLHKRIDEYIISSDKLSQFHDAAVIAKEVLVEVDILNSKKNCLEYGKPFFIMISIEADNEMLPFTKLEKWLKDHHFTYRFTDHLQKREFKIICDNFTDAATLETYLQTNQYD